MATSSPTRQRQIPGRGMLLFGLAVVAAGVIGYAVQIAAHRLITPWYLAALATLSVLLVGLALAQARSVWRWLAMVFVVLLAVATWALILGTRLPEYTGPVAAGQPFPAFATVRADGSPFTQAALQGDENTVLVFFRGRW